MKKTKTKGRSKKKTSVIKDFNFELPKRNRITRAKEPLYHNNPFQSNESIVKSIIDKIIIISVREAYLKSLKKTYKNYYFDYMHKQLNSLLSTNFCFYYDEPESSCHDKLYWNNKLENSNSWVEIIEPSSSKIDRYENSFIKYVNYVPPNLPTEKNDKNNNYINRANTLNEEALLHNNRKELVDAKIKKNSDKKFSLKLKKFNKEGENAILEYVEEKSSISSKDEDNTERNKKRGKNINFNVRKSIKKKIFSQNEFQKSSTSNSPRNQENKIDNNKEIDDENQYLSKTRKKPQILPLDIKEIPGIDKEFNFDAYSPPGVEHLRKEIEEEKIRKEKDIKKFALIKKISINYNENNTDLDSGKIKIIDSTKLTFDSNGKIINFKPISLDSLSRDFASVKNGIKSLEDIAKTNIKRTNTKYNKNKSTQPANTQKEKSKEKEKVIKNPEDDPDGINKFKFVKLSPDKREQKIPSGSNFSLLLPNIGVTLKENDQIKQGARDFGKYFKKYSLNDYDKILRDYLPLQNKAMLKSSMNSSSNTLNMNLTSLKKIPKNYTINTNTTYKNNSMILMGNNTNPNNTFGNKNIYNNLGTDLSNPLIGQQETIKENYTNTNINNSSSLMKTAKSNISHMYSGNNLYSSFPLSKLNDNSNYSETRYIKLNKNCLSTSLKDEIENLKDLNDKSNFNFYPSKKKLKTRNIFHVNYKELTKNKIEKKENILKDDKSLNDFNKKIVMDRGWGNKPLNKNNSTGNLLYSKHLTKYQALRELGSNLLNGIKVKLPRERKVDIHI